MHRLCMKNNPTKEKYIIMWILDEQNYRFAFLNTSDIPYFLNEENQYPFGWRLEVLTDRQMAGAGGAVNRQENLIFSHLPLHNAGYSERKECLME